MSPNRRIFINVIATYGRSILALVLALFSTRWALMALGEVDYGLRGLVGGLTSMVAILNSVLAASTGRFFAYSIGETMKIEKLAAGKNGSNSTCVVWFNIAFVLHAILACVLVLIGYPVGKWLVTQYLNIPADRMIACVWVWRFSCITCFCSMITVPFSAIYTAKQEIAELTIYSVFTSLANFILLFFMVRNPGDWLVKYSLLFSLITIAPLIVMTCRCFFVFPECRFVRWSPSRSLDKIKQLLVFSVARFWADIAGVVTNQGTAILVNKALGPVYNSSMTIGNGLALHANTLSAAMHGAMFPAVTSAAGANDYSKMRMLSYQMCKFCGLFVLIFAVPLLLEVDILVDIWLKYPPPYVAWLARFCLIAFIIDGITLGLSASIEAMGRIFLFKFLMGSFAVSSVLVAWLLIRCGYGVIGVGMAMVITRIPYLFLRVFYARKCAMISARNWIRKVLVPILLSAGIGVLVGTVPHFVFEPSFVRVLVTGACCVVAMFVVSWIKLLSGADRDFIVRRIRARA